MIFVTRLNGSRIAINPDLIERAVETPDTTLTLVDGSKHVVTESLERVIDLIADERADIVARASMKRAEMLTAGPRLSVVPDPDDTTGEPRTR